MQDRQPTDQEYFLYVLHDNETPDAVREMLCHTYSNGVILYPSDSSSSSSGARTYNAYFVINREFIVNKDKERIEVSVGNQLLNEKGLIPTEAKYHAELIHKALAEKSNKKRLALIDMQHTRQENDAPRLEHARALKQVTDAALRKQKENAANEAAIFHILTEDAAELENEEEKSNSTLEHKQPQAKVDKSQCVSDHPKVVEEVAPRLQPKELGELILAYAANFDPTTNQQTDGHDILNIPTTEYKFASLSIFGNPFLSLVETATELGEMIRRGEESEIAYVLSQVKKYPAFLDVKVTTKGPQNIVLEEKTLIEIAFMEGDIDFKEGITDEKEHGLVERLAAAGELSNERVAEDSKCVTSDEAKAENEARIKRCVDIMIKFGESVSNGQIKDDAIKQLEEDLLEERKKHPVKFGLVFDPRILHETAQWFEKNVDTRFDYWWSDKSDIFWVNGFGKLQSMLSARDAQVVRAGIANLVDDGIIPPRTLKNSDNTSFFYNANSRLGSDFYLGIYGRRRDGAAWMAAVRGVGLRFYSNLMSSKNSSIAKLCNIQTSQRSMHA